MNEQGKQTVSKDWCQIAEQYIPNLTSSSAHRILDDATDFYQVDYGNVLLLNNVGYLVRNRIGEEIWAGGGTETMDQELR